MLTPKHPRHLQGLTERAGACGEKYPLEHPLHLFFLLLLFLKVMFSCVPFFKSNQRI
jgi:hypothetical protein